MDTQISEQLGLNLNEVQDQLGCMARERYIA